MRGSFIAGIWNKVISADPDSRRRWPYAWLAAPVAAALAVPLAAVIPVQQAGTAVQATTVTVLLAGSAILAVTPGVALVSVLARRRRLGLATALGLLYAGAGAAAMAGFWAWFARPKLGVMFDTAVLAVSVAAIAVFGRRGDLGRLGLALPLALALAVSALYTGLAFLQGGVSGVPWIMISHRFWTEYDNDLPMVFATRVAAHAPLGRPCSGAGCRVTGRRCKPGSSCCSGRCGPPWAVKRATSSSAPCCKPPGCRPCGRCSASGACRSAGPSRPCSRRPRPG